MRWKKEKDEKTKINSSPSHKSETRRGNPFFEKKKKMVSK